MLSGRPRRTELSNIAQPQSNVQGNQTTFTIAVEDFQNKIIDPSPITLLTLKDAKTGAVIATTTGTPGNNNNELNFIVILAHPPGTVLELAATYDAFRE